MKRLAYLCLQATREGQASHAHVHEIIKGLQRRGWDVELFEPAYVSSTAPPGYLWRFWEFIRLQLKLWTSGKVNVLYIRWHFATWLTALWARGRGVPVVQEVNGPYEDLFIAWPGTRRLARLFVWLMRSQLRWADAVIAVTPQLADWVRMERGRDGVFVVPNGANTELFHPGAALGPGLHLRRPYVIFFGALARWQGVETMLVAAQHPAWPDEVDLVVVGDGVERGRVELAAARCSRVRYLGLQPYACIPGLVARSLAGLLPKSDPGGRASTTGLFPLKLFETLACGVPAVVTDFPGVADLVREDDCGLVIPPEDPEALAQAVDYLHRHPDKRELMGRRGRELVEREHSWDRRAKDTDAVLDGVLIDSQFSARRRRQSRRGVP